jgi:hypothetical protein
VDLDRGCCTCGTIESARVFRPRGARVILGVQLMLRSVRSRRRPGCRGGGFRREVSPSMGSIPATGRTVTLKLCDVTEFRDGKVKSQRSYFDTASMMAQLGLGADQAAATT